VPWFAFIAIAQLRLTDLEGSWSTGFTVLVIGGGLAFVVAALLAGGTAPARGRIEVRREDFALRRLVIVAVFLLAAGCVGAWYKAHLLGDVPLLSGNADLIRGRAGGGDIAVPAWASALTDCFFLSMWAALAALWVLPRRSRRWAAGGLVLLAGLGVFGATLEASRNITLLALAIPAIAVYLIARPARRRARLAQLGVGLAIVLVVVGGAFVVRLTQTESAGHDYLTAETKRQPPALRPVIPLYINGVFPLEAERRLYEEVPGHEPYGLGSYGLLSLPDAFYPEGKPDYGDVVGLLMQNRAGNPAEGGLNWTVATYQGRAYADLGAPGVILLSLLLGLAFGRLYRWARSRDGFLSVAIVGYVAYYSALMLYDNLLSFTIIAVFDLFAIMVLERYVRDAGLRATLGRLAGAEARP
jgi:hypothetical protein